MKKIRYKNFDEVLRALEKMEKYSFKLIGDWDGYQHVMHCANSIQYSTTGYPTGKPYLLQETLGKTAFYLFKSSGALSHNTNAFTPGDEPIPKNGLQSGIDNYRSQIIRFLDWDLPLCPHPFFGTLSKNNFIRFHAMHFANHFEQFEF